MKSSWLMLSSRQAARYSSAMRSVKNLQRDVGARRRVRSSRRARPCRSGNRPGRSRTAQALVAGDGIADDGGVGVPNAARPRRSRWAWSGSRNRRMHPTSAARYTERGAPSTPRPARLWRGRPPTGGAFGEGFDEGEEGEGGQSGPRAGRTASATRLGELALLTAARDVWRLAERCWPLKRPLPEGGVGMNGQGDILQEGTHFEHERRLR